MPPRRYSRHTFSTAFRTDAGLVLLTDPEPFRYKDLPDNTVHRSKQGETVFSLAGRYFRGLPRPAGLFWVIMDFQPTPIHDPTISLTNGQILFIPSIRTVVEEIFGEQRREE